MAGAPRSPRCSPVTPGETLRVTVGGVGTDGEDSENDLGGDAGPGGANTGGGDGGVGSSFVAPNDQDGAGGEGGGGGGGGSSLVPAGGTIEGGSCTGDGSVTLTFEVAPAPLVIEPTFTG